MVSMVATIALHFTPVWFLSKTRYLWIYMGLEQRIQYYYSWIGNRNDVHALYKNNFVAFWAFLWIESMSNPGSDIL